VFYDKKSRNSVLKTNIITEMMKEISEQLTHKKVEMFLID